MVFFFKFPQILPQFMSLSYSCSHVIFALGNTCGLRIFCIHFGFKSFGLLKLLLFDNRDVSTSFIFPFLFLDKFYTFFSMETYVFGIATLIWEYSEIQFLLSNKELYIWILFLKLRISSSQISIIVRNPLNKNDLKNRDLPRNLYFHYKIMVYQEYPAMNSA